MNLTWKLIGCEQLSFILLIITSYWSSFVEPIIYLAVDSISNHWSIKSVCIFNSGSSKQCQCTIIMYR